MNEQNADIEKIKEEELKKFLAGKLTAKNLTYCPECSDKLVHHGGCIECKQCFWSACG